MNTLARSVSILLHPLFITTLAVVMMMNMDPYSFASLDKGKTIAAFAINTIFFPALSILLMYRLRFIDSLEMKGRKERIGPLMATMVFYLWTYLFVKQGGMPIILAAFVLGVLIALFLGFFTTIFYKLSLHMLAMGGLLGFVIIQLIFSGADYSYALPLVILLTGLVATSRLWLGAHDLNQIYVGWITGLAGQFAAVMFFLS